MGCEEAIVATVNFHTLSKLRLEPAFLLPPLTHRTGKKAVEEAARDVGGTGGSLDVAGFASHHPPASTLSSWRRGDGLIALAFVISPP